MNFTFHQLKVFISVVDNKSVTKAAQQLNMTQPAVSIQLKNLQDQFEIHLTEVVGRKLYVTDFGYEVYAIAESVVQEVNNINYRTQNYRGMLSGRLRITVASTGKYVMPYYLKGFLNLYPSIDLAMDVTNKSRVIKSLESNEVDFSMVSVLPEHLALEQEVLLPNKLYLMVGGKAEPDQEGEINRSIFSSIPLIYREEGSGTRYSMQQYFGKMQVIPKIKMELTSSEAVKQAVLAGLGYSIQPILSVKNELRQKEIRIVPVEGLPLVENWRLVWLREKKMSIVATAYINYLRQNKTHIYNEHFSWIEEY